VQQYYISIILVFPHHIDKMKTTLLPLSIIIALFTLILSECLVEYFWRLQIKNNTKRDVELLVYFNKATFDKAWQGLDYHRFLHTYGIQMGSGINLKYLDADSLIGHYTISSQGYWEISGRGRQPDFSEVKRFSVTTNTYQVTLPSRNAMVENFKPDSMGAYIWQIR
jgi:hypothetical protein